MNHHYLPPHKVGTKRATLYSHSFRNYKMENPSAIVVGGFSRMTGMPSVCGESPQGA